MKRLIPSIFFVTLSLLAQSQEATFIAKPYLNIGRQPSPTTLDLLWQVPEGNAAMIVLNTEYWESKDPLATSGCPEGYIMDQQTAWLRTTITICVNNSKKFLAFISGDEHNFSFLPLTPQTPIYLPDVRLR